MTINNEIQMANTNIFRSSVVPVFMPSYMEQPMADDAAETEKEVILSLFDVKEIYDLAYAEKEKGAAGEEAFKKLLAEAVKMDLAYRRQLNKQAMYKDRTKERNFKSASKGSRVA